METTGNRKLLIAVGMVLFLVIIALVWYFVYAKPIVAPSMATTNDPTPTRSFPPRFQFLNWGGDETQTITEERSDPKKDPLIQIWKKPATGQFFITGQTLQEINATTTEGTSTKVITVKKTIRATSTSVLFADKTTGYIYRYSLESGKTTQVSNTIVPGLHDAYFFENGTRVILRYIDQEKNTVVGLIAAIPTVPEEGTSLPLENMQYLTSEVISIATDKNHTQVAYVVATPNGSAVYAIVGKTPKLVTTSPFREWDLSIAGNALYVTTKPSAYVSGGTYKLPSFTSQFDEKTGLMSNPGLDGTILNSMWGKNGLVSFFSYNGILQVLPITTLASKCTWDTADYLVCAVPKFIPRGEEGIPDDWFQGRLSFDDDLVIVNKKTNTSYALYSFNQEKEGVFDIDTIAIQTGGGIYSFTNTNDETLWLLNTNNIGSH